MRGQQNPQVSMLALVDVETLIPSDHPLRTIKSLADAALGELSPVFDAMPRLAARRFHPSGC